ncbi:hypothetical protein NYE67_02655 [Solibacillus sp. FSL W8-0474]|uniref:hypothetical protein n=1 Tax=Solibacillus sp. FSL W8-0474 TaxID=2975336 RepID=UPI0030FC331A
MIKNENLIIQQGTIKLIKIEIKEIKILIKKMRKDVKATGFIEIERAMEIIFKEFEQNLLPIENAIKIWKFRDATPESVVYILGAYKTVKEYKQLVMDAYSQV